MRRAAVLLVAISCTVWTFAQSTPPAAATPAGPPGWPTAPFAASKDPSVHKAYEVLNQMLTALGGDAWLNVQSMTSEGRSYSFYHGQPNSSSILYWRFWQWPDKERLEVGKKRDVVELLIGDQGYEVTYRGTATQDPKDLEESLRRRAHSLEWVVRKWLPAPGTMILYSGTAMVERNLADQVTVLNAENDSVIISVDSTTRLPVKVSYSWRDPLDRQFDEGATVFSNYKLVQGVQTPFSVVQYRNDEMSGQRFLTSASYNAPLAPTLFETKGLTYNPDKQSSPK
jgi:hypothetical protein